MAEHFILLFFFYYILSLLRGVMIQIYKSMYILHFFHCVMVKPTSRSHLLHKKQLF